MIRPTRAKNRRLRVLVVAIRSPTRFQRARLCAITCRQPGAVGGERGHVVQPDAVLEVAYRIYLGVAAMISLQSSISPSRSVMKP